MSKILTFFFFNKTKGKNKKHFCRYRLKCFSSEKVLLEHKETYFQINGKQTVKLKSDSIKCKNNFKKIAASFKIYPDFECNFHTLRKIKIPCSFACKIVRIDDKFSKPVALYGGENAVYKFIDAILKEYDYCKKLINEHFNKNLVISVVDNKRFKSSNKCWICNKLFTNQDKTGKGS